MNCSGCRYVAVIDGSSHCAAPSCIKDEHIVEQYDEKKELTARINELERREAMLVAKIERVLPTLRADKRCPTGVTDTLQQALSATSADTEAWLQAEILKRLGEPVGYLIKPSIYAREEKLLNENRREFASSKFVRSEFWERDFPLYRLPSPLATPEERKE